MAGIDPFKECPLDIACHPRSAELHDLSSYLNLVSVFHPPVPSHFALGTQHGVTVVKALSHLKPCPAP